VEPNVTPTAKANVEVQPAPAPKDNAHAAKAKTKLKQVDVVSVKTANVLLILNAVLNKLVALKVMMLARPVLLTLGKRAVALKIYFNFFAYL
jgi:hypothetical protein